MCGISGIVCKDPKKYSRQLGQMVISLAHRGPDGSAIRYLPGCALAHNRLNIIDLKTGAQPMGSSGNNLTIVFNGEIYGYQEIKSKLTEYRFRTTSDTEVILALYEKHKERLLTHLPGMFAFAIWDKSKQELFCARDRFGEKPFYYCFGSSSEFIFASEIKGLLSSGLVTPVLDPTMVEEYLKYLCVPANKTIYKNIFVLPPGHSLRFRRGRVTIKKYWDFPAINADLTFPEAVNELRKLTAEAVRKQLIADVPVGVFLSGGLDSSTIVAVASRYKTKIMTFAFGFGENKDELPFAARVAKKYKTDHTVLTPKDADLGELLVRMQEVYDEPFADSSNIPTYLLAQLARTRVKVVLTGDGGDEMFAGYSWYRQLLGRRSLLSAHRSQLCYFPKMLKVGLASGAATETMEDVLQTDVENYLPADILVKTDRAAMANGLELRAPFLDYPLANFCLSLPAAYKISPTESKIILRRGFEAEWPEEIRWRRKQGFGAPVKEWLKTSEISKLKRDYLGSRYKKICYLLPFDKVQEYAKTDNYQTWILLVLSLWLEKHHFKFI